MILDFLSLFKRTNKSLIQKSTVKLGYASLALKKHTINELLLAVCQTLDFQVFVVGCCCIKMYFVPLKLVYEFTQSV